MSYIKKGIKYPPVEEQLQNIENFFETEVSREEEIFADYSMAVAVEIAEELKKRGMTQKDLAKLIGKREPEINKWLSGFHNFTLRSLAKISAALNKKLIYTETEAKRDFTRH